MEMREDPYALDPGLLGKHRGQLDKLAILIHYLRINGIPWKKVTVDGGKGLEIGWEDSHAKFSLQVLERIDRERILEYLREIEERHALYRLYDALPDESEWYPIA